MSIARPNGGHQEPLWCWDSRAATIDGVIHEAEEAHMDPYLFSQLYRERLAQFEREAQYRRDLPKRERRLLRQVSSLLMGSRRPARLVPTTAAEACTCR